MTQPTLRFVSNLTRETTLATAGYRIAHLRRLPGFCCSSLSPEARPQVPLSADSAQHFRGRAAAVFCVFGCRADRVYRAQRADTRMGD